MNFMCYFFLAEIRIDNLETSQSTPSFFLESIFLQNKRIFGSFFLKSHLRWLISSLLSKFYADTSKNELKSCERPKLHAVWWWYISLHLIVKLDMFQWSWSILSTSLKRAQIYFPDGRNLFLCVSWNAHYYRIIYYKKWADKFNLTNFRRIL